MPIVLAGPRVSARTLRFGRRHVVHPPDSRDREGEGAFSVLNLSTGVYELTHLSRVVTWNYKLPIQTER
jgi:hypothetical protein